MLTDNAVDPLCDINASLDNVMGLGASLAHDPLFDCSLPDLGTCIPHPAMPTPVSSSCSTSNHLYHDLSPHKHLRFSQAAPQVLINALKQVQEQGQADRYPVKSIAQVRVTCRKYALPPSSTAARSSKSETKDIHDRSIGESRVTKRKAVSGRITQSRSATDLRSTRNTPPWNERYPASLSSGYAGQKPRMVLPDRPTVVARTTQGEAGNARRPRLR